MAGRLWHLIRHGLVRLRWPLSGLVAVMVILACVLVIPRCLVQWELGASVRTLTAADRAKAINDVRVTLLQGIGGAVLLLGAYFTYRQLQTGREQLEVARQQAQASAEQAREQLAIAQQGQVTERFTRAIDQLGHTELDVRLGGIYALERIANDSPDHRATIAEVLTAFVRGHAPWPPKRPVDRLMVTKLLMAFVRQHVPWLPKPRFGDSAAGAIRTAVGQLRRRMPDVHAAMTVLGRAHWRDRSIELQLNDTDLRGAFLPDADLQGFFLWEVHLEGARLPRAELRGAFLGNAHLTEASLRDTDLDGANLQGADLRGARLTGARFAGAKLDGAHLHGAKDDARTTWPPGFDRVAAGVVSEEPTDGQYAGREPGRGHRGVSH
jgi:Pentapeptide repeats (8 copies)